VQPSRIPSLLSPHIFLNFLLLSALGLFSFLKGSEKVYLGKITKTALEDMCSLSSWADTEAAFLEIS
jgi:hypothetical protein